jgi:hypothetical protein
MVSEFRVGDAPANKEVNAKLLAFVWHKESRVFFCPLFYGVPVQKLHSIFSCLKKPNKIKNEVWFYVLMITSSIITVVLDHQNKCRPALCVEVPSL